MARCGCQSTTCSCSVKGGTGVVVQGVGTLSRPYTINIDAGKITVDDTPTIDMRLTGSGTSSDPYHVSGVATLNLDALTDVTSPNPANGQVLAYDFASRQWKPAPPATTAPGAVAVGDGLTGDGSTGSRLAARPNLAAGIQVDANGIGLQSGILQAINLAASRRMAAGNVNVVYTTSSWSSVLVTFPVGLFTVPPIVVATADSHPSTNPYGAQAYSITKDSCRIGARLPAVAAGTMAVHWIALQLT